MQRNPQQVSSPRHPVYLFFGILSICTQCMSRCFCTGLEKNSTSVGDMRSEVEATAPELLPLWRRHGHQVPEELALDLNLGGVRRISQVDHTEFRLELPLHESIPC